MPTLPLRILLLLALCLCLEPPCQAQSSELSGDALARVRRATVEIHARGQQRGGGVFVRDSKGKTFVVTAAHLFKSPRDTCHILTSDDQFHFASLTAYDLGRDLALLEVAPDLSRYGALSIADAVPRETRAIFNIGPALGRRSLFLSGTVADTRICYTDFSSSNGYLAHYFAAAISPVLTSGGVWVNPSGQVVGIQHGRLKGDAGAPSSGLSMVSFPADIKSLVESKRIAATPCLGGYFWELWTADPSLHHHLPEGTQGLLVKPVFKNRPLARSGVKPNDIILRCDGDPIVRRHQLIRKVRSKPVGTTFRLEVYTPGQSQTRIVPVVSDSLEQHWH